MLLRQLHQRAAGIDQQNARADAGEGDRSALVNFNLEAVGDEAHHAGRLDPGNLFELRLLLRERDEENVAANVGAHHFHDLRLGHVLHAGDFDVVARLDAEAPGVLAVFDRGRRRRWRRRTEWRRQSRPTAGGWQFSWEANCGGRRHAFARAEMGIPRPHPDRPGARRRVPRAAIQRVNARRWVGTTLPARWCRWISAPSVQVSCREESLSFFNIASFLELR